jgi:hypothetical protein
MDTIGHCWIRYQATAIEDTVKIEEKACAVVDRRVHEIGTELKLPAVTICESQINPITNANPISSNQIYDYIYK